MRLERLGALLRACLLVLGVGVVGCTPGVLEPREPTPGVPHFKVATYNIFSLMETDDPTLAAIGATDADIVCLQEVTPVWKERLRERYSAEYPYMLFREHTGASGLGVLSRYPLTGGELEFVADWHPAWHVDAQTPAGWLQVLVVHLRADFTGEGGYINSYLDVNDDHVLQAEVFTSNGAQGVPTVVLGDFNEGPNAPAVEYIESLGFRNALPLYHPGQYTWRKASVGDQLDMPIDHVLFDGWTDSLNAYVLVEGNSDHIPVVAHLEQVGEWPLRELTPDPSEALP